MNIKRLVPIDGYAQSGAEVGKIMKKRVFWLCLLLLLGFGIAGCSYEQKEVEKQIVRGGTPSYEEGYINIGLIQTGKESDWRDANTNDYLDTFTKENGYNLIYIDGNSDADRQIKAMNDLIAQRVDYIILQPIVESGWEETMERANQAGIPVIVADRQIAVDESKYVTWIGSDFQAEGEKAIAWLEGYLEEQGRKEDNIRIVILEGTQGATATIGRTQGIADKLKEHENWELLTSECANFTQGEGQTVMEQILENIDGKEIDVIISENDNMIFGAMKALQRKGLSYGPDGRIIMISFDALGEAFEKMMEGELHASIECNPLLASSVEAVIKKLERGEAVEKKYYTEEGVYTYLNAAQFIEERAY